MNDDLSIDFLSQNTDRPWSNDERISMLEWEISHIVNPKVEALVRYLLSKSDAFWVAPVESLDDQDEDRFSADEYEPGGLVLHVRRTIKSMVYMLNAYPDMTGDECDAMLAALLLRNITKCLFINEERNLIFDHFHLYTVERFAFHCMAQSEAEAEDMGSLLNSDAELFDLIFRLIRVSDGFQSTIPETQPVSPLERLMSIIIIFASTAHLIVRKDNDGTE